MTIEGKYDIPQRLVSAQVQSCVDRSQSSANYVTITRYRRVELIADFLRDASAYDRYWRFGNCGSATVDWLIERLHTDRSRGAYVAESGGLITGLLDFVGMSEGIEFGVLVRPTWRRQGIGISLITSFLSGFARSRPGTRIVAYCDLENYAALRLMGASGLQPTQLDSDWTRFETIVAAPA